MRITGLQHEGMPTVVAALGPRRGGVRRQMDDAQAMRPLAVGQVLVQLGEIVAVAADHAAGGEGEGLGRWSGGCRSRSPWYPSGREVGVGCRTRRCADPRR